VCELICKIPDAGVFFVKILDEEKERERERERERRGGGERQIANMYRNMLV